MKDKTRHTIHIHYLPFWPNCNIKQRRQSVKILGQIMMQICQVTSWWVNTAANIATTGFTSYSPGQGLQLIFSTEYKYGRHIYFWRMDFFFSLEKKTEKGGGKKPAFDWGFLVPISFNKIIFF